MPRTEVLNEWFFPIPSLRKGGVIVPAPEEAVKKYQEQRDGWMKKLPELPHEIPIVGLKPKVQEDKEGYLVTTEIMYR